MKCTQLLCFVLVLAQYCIVHTQSTGYHTVLRFLFGPDALTRSVSEWSCRDVGQWVAEQGFDWPQLPSYCSALCDVGINGGTLHAVDDEVLRHDVVVSISLHRKLLLEALQRLQATQGPTADPKGPLAGPSAVQASELAVQLFYISLLSMPRSTLLIYWGWRVLTPLDTSVVSQATANAAEPATASQQAQGLSQYGRHTQLAEDMRRSSLHAKHWNAMGERDGQWETDLQGNTGRNSGQKKDKDESTELSSSAESMAVVLQVLDKLQSVLQVVLFVFSPGIALVYQGLCSIGRANAAIVIHTTYMGYRRASSESDLFKRLLAMWQGRDRGGQSSTVDISQLLATLYYGLPAVCTAVIAILGCVMQYGPAWMSSGLYLVVAAVLPCWSTWCLKRGFYEYEEIWGTVRASNPGHFDDSAGSSRAPSPRDRHSAAYPTSSDEYYYSTSDMGRRSSLTRSMSAGGYLRSTQSRQRGQRVHATGPVWGPPGAERLGNNERSRDWGDQPEGVRGWREQIRQTDGQVGRRVHRSASWNTVEDVHAGPWHVIDLDDGEEATWQPPLQLPERLAGHTPHEHHGTPRGLQQLLHLSDDDSATTAGGSQGPHRAHHRAPYRAAGVPRPPIGTALHHSPLAAAAASRRHSAGLPETQTDGQNNSTLRRRTVVRPGDTDTLTEERRLVRSRSSSGSGASGRDSHGQRGLGEGVLPVSQRAAVGTDQQLESAFGSMADGFGTADQGSSSAIENAESVQRGLEGLERVLRERRAQRAETAQGTRQGPSQGPTALQQDMGDSRGVEGARRLRRQNAFIVRGDFDINQPGNLSRSSSADPFPLDDDQSVQIGFRNDAREQPVSRVGEPAQPTWHPVQNILLSALRMLQDRPSQGPQGSRGAPPRAPWGAEYSGDPLGPLWDRFGTLADDLRTRRPRRGYGQTDGQTYGQGANVRWPEPLHIPEAIDQGVPAYLCCPITLQLMRQPALAPSGVTFEYAAICQWLDRHSHSRDPVSRQPLRRQWLVPNLAVRSAIEDWVAQQLVGECARPSC